MRRAALVLLAAATAFAQALVRPSRVPVVARHFEPQPGEATLACEVGPIKPALNYGFRFGAGYQVRVPMRQFAGTGHRWSIAVEITPEAAGSSPVYLISYQALPPVPKTNIADQVNGGFLLGEGRYRARWVLYDERQRVCRKEWTIDAHLSFSDRHVRLSIPPNTVAALSGAPSGPGAVPPDDIPPLRLTVLLDAAPLFSRRNTLVPSDHMMLLSAVSSLLERVPGRAERPELKLVAFSLAQQKEILRRERFTFRDLADLDAALGSLELAKVDYHILENRHGHLDLLAKLAAEEILDDQPDAVIFLGARSRYFDKFPAGALPEAAGPPRFFYFQFRPVPQYPVPILPDSINFLIDGLKGKTFTIHTPADFHKAIEQLERAAAGRAETAARF
jgi:hypothetical protein